MKCHVRKKRKSLLKDVKLKIIADTPKMIILIGLIHCCQDVLNLKTTLTMNQKKFKIFSIYQDN